MGPDSFERARNRLEHEGLLVDGWIVLTHDDDLDSSHQDLFVRNAYGEAYSYALCPRADDVREYCRTLVQETLRIGSLRGVILEACGPMGVDHGSTHDKVAMANWSLVQQQLLSLCFCHACEIGLSDAGVDPLDLARRVREALARDAATMEDALDHDTATVAAYRQSLSTDLQLVLTEAARQVQPDIGITVHASANPWATGSFPTCSSASLASVTCAVANCWDPGSAEDELDRLSANTANLGAYLRLDHDWSHLESDLTRYAGIGVKELHLYHLGLLSVSSAETAERMIREWTSGAGPTHIDEIEEVLNDG
jgi:hypothetical protein